MQKSKESKKRNYTDRIVKCTVFPEDRSVWDSGTNECTHISIVEEEFEGGYEFEKAIEISQYDVCQEGDYNKVFIRSVNEWNIIKNRIDTMIKDIENNHPEEQNAEE